jgi:PAS domain S-box-containing protein
LVDDTISNYDLLNLLKDPVFILDGTTYLFVNQAAAELLGYEDSKELIGIPAFQHVAPSSRDLSRSFAKARQNGENVPDRYTMQLIDKHGKQIDVEAHVSSIIFDGKPASLAVNHDLSEITKFTKQLASFHQYSVELASMSEIQEIADKTIEIIVDSLGYARMSTE